MQAPLEAQFSNRLTENFPEIFGKRVLVAVSGGLDSVTLAQLLSKAGVEIAVAHVNFQLRGLDSERDAAFVKDLAARLGVPYHVKRAAVAAYRTTHNASIQMAARAIRYEWFEQLSQAHGYDFTATAHQREDSLETLLLNLSRGTGIEGLTGIQPKQGQIIRPLCCFSKAAIKRYALDQGIDWREDRSNASNAYMRNKIRNHILPEFDELHPNARENLAKSIGRLQSIETIALAAIERNLNAVRLPVGEVVEIDLTALRKLKPLQTHLHYLLKAYGFFDLTAYEKFVFAPQPGKQFHSKTHHLLIDRDRWIVQPLSNEAPQHHVLQDLSDFAQEGVPLEAAVTTALKRDKKTACVDGEKIVFPLKLRKWQKGDRFEPLGLNGSKKLSAYFTDEKLSRLAKEKVWILENGNGAIIWVVGHRLDERFKVGETTRSIISFTRKNR